VTSQADRADVVLLIACRNENTALRWILPRVPHGVDVVLCDNDSDDGSVALAAAFGAMVVTERRHRRVGAAIRRGVESSTAPIIAVIDGDGTVDPRDVLTLIEPIRSGRADVVLGARVMTDRGRPFPQVMTRVRNGLLRAVTGTPVADLGTARAFSRVTLVPRLSELNERYAWNLSSTLAVMRASGPTRVASVPIAHHARIGRSQISGSFRGSLVAVADSLLVFSRFLFASGTAEEARQRVPRYLRRRRARNSS
jgi:glycosyltransferase involved in cell wall biosynthesis